MGFDYSTTRKEVQLISLNDLLDQLEVDISRVGEGNLVNAQNLLVKLDEAQQRIDTMVQKNLPVKAESAQFDYLVSTLEKNAKKELNDLGGARQLGILRKQNPDGQNFRWWHLDEINAKQRKKSLSKILIFTGIAGLLLVAFMLIYEAFLKPDPAVTGKYTHQMNAEQSLSRGDFEKALVDINLALEYAPSDADLFVLRGVIHTMLGNSGQANEDFFHAESSLDNRINFLLLRSQAWLNAGEYRNSIADSQVVVQEDPTSAEGYFYLGRANELLQNYSAAINAYETAANLANSQGKVELNASIRITLAMLMQSIQALPATIQQTPTP